MADMVLTLPATIMLNNDLAHGAVFSYEHV